jgi:SAM-dependent methyltransferase
LTARSAAALRSGHPPCIVCAGGSTEPFWRDDLVRCTACGLVRAADRFFQVDAASLYGANYYTGAEYVDYRGDRTAARVNARRRIRALRKLAPEARRLFEIGCGYGYFLELATEHWAASGIEVSAHAAREAQRSQLLCACGDYLTVSNADRADIVCLWDTIEHLAAPRAVLHKAASELPPGGLLAISTGDIDALLPRVQRHRWRLIHPPTHLWYFSVATLTALLRETGFELIRVVRPFFFRSLRLYVPRLARYLPAIAGDCPVPLQTGDLVEIYARRTTVA